MTPAPISVERLRRLADAAIASEDDWYSYDRLTCNPPRVFDSAAAMFINHASPQVIIALLQQLAELEAARDAAADLDNEDRRNDAEFWWTVAAFRAREMAGALTEAKRSQEEWLSLKDQYSELARAIGCEGDAWFGDPIESHEAVIAKAKAAERAREGACGLLLEWADDAEANGFAASEYPLVARTRAFLAASGGA